MTKQKFILNEQQALLVKYLKGEAKGDITKAKKLAGYANGTSVKSLLANEELSKAVVQAAKDILAENSVKAAYGLVDVLDDPTAMGAKNTISAANSLFDRVGISKDKDAGNEPLKGAIVILPAKNE